jgi:UDP-N-acetylmuramyl-tripeptide synthetase
MEGKSMLLKDVLKDVQILYKSKNYNDQINIDYLTEDTKDITEQSCFICKKGSKIDSHDLINTFTTNPSLIIAERQIETEVPYIIVQDTLKLLPLICFNFYENPSSKLTLVGVTGTDGKTTTAFVTKQIIDKFADCAYVGTNGFIYKQNYINNKLTTPKPITLNHFLKNLNNDQINYASIEVSSQGLDLHRVDYLNFKVAIFTNLSHEHLDFHKTIDNYFLSKLKLFEMLSPDSYAIVNIDAAPYANRIIETTKAKVITYGTSIDADFKISNIKVSLTSTTFDLLSPNGNYKNINLNLFGDYNVFNATAALAAGLSLGFEVEKMIPILSHLEAIDGRMVQIDCGQPFNVVVDFAHTPNALNCLLKNLYQCKQNDISIVFGSAGERDVSKRPKMGEVVSNYANNMYLTSEDPKSEDPLDIINDILNGVKDLYKVSIIPNRKQAILKALETAQVGDTVVITGKGNENIEVFNGYIAAHNDIIVAEKFLKEKYQDPYTYSIANM